MCDDLAATIVGKSGDDVINGLLKAEGLVVNRKRTYRLYTELGLQIRYLSGASS
jgi:hypothetical protein